MLCRVPCLRSSMQVSLNHHRMSMSCICRVYLNPGAGSRRTGIASSPWAAQEGQDFLANNVVPDIDFATTHIWMDNWLGYGDYSTCILCDLNFDYSHGEYKRGPWWQRLSARRSAAGRHPAAEHAL